MCIFSVRSVLNEHWRDAAPVITEVNGHFWLSGGHWGAEASLYCLLTLVLVKIYLYKSTFLKTA